MVALFHASWASHAQIGFTRNAYLLVDLFFVLSGFVMAHAYSDRIHTAADTRRFMLLRLGRIYPLHLVILLVWGAVVLAKFVVHTWQGQMPVTVGPQPDLVSFVANLLLIHSTGVTPDVMFNQPSWSISAEFWAYVAFALINMLAASRMTRLQLALSVSILSAALLIYLRGKADLTAVGDFGVLRCLCGFFVGVLAYEAYKRLKSQSLSPILANLCALGLLAWLAFKHRGASDFAVIPFSALLIVLLASCPTSAASRLLSRAPLLRLGAISYSFYMVHFAISRGMAQVLGRIFPEARTQAFDIGLHGLPLWIGDLANVVYLLAAFIIASFTWRTIEVPCREWARRWTGHTRAVDTATVQS